MSYATNSGEVSDSLGTGAVTPARGGASAGRFGSGEGDVRCTTTSGDLTIEP